MRGGIRGPRDTIMFTLGAHTLHLTRWAFIHSNKALSSHPTNQTTYRHAYLTSLRPITQPVNQRIRMRIKRSSFCPVTLPLNQRIHKLLLTMSYFITQARQSATEYTCLSNDVLAEQPAKHADQTVTCLDNQPIKLSMTHRSHFLPISLFTCKDVDGRELDCFGGMAVSVHRAG